MIMMSGRVGWKARARLVGGNPKLFLFQVQLRRPTTILLMIAHLGKIPTLRKTSLISASICTNARASGQSNVFTKPKKKSSHFLQIILNRPIQKLLISAIYCPMHYAASSLGKFNLSVSFSLGSFASDKTIWNALSLSLTYLGASWLQAHKPANL